MKRTLSRENCRQGRKEQLLANSWTARDRLAGGALTGGGRGGGQSQVLEVAARLLLGRESLAATDGSCSGSSQSSSCSTPVHGSARQQLQQHACLLSCSSLSIRGLIRGQRPQKKFWDTP